MCMTSQLQSIQISNSVESSSEESSYYSEDAGDSIKKEKTKKKEQKVKDDELKPDKQAVVDEKNKKRRKSFDLTLLKEFKYKHEGKTKKAKENLARLLEGINHEMGMNATEKESDDEIS